MRDAPTWARMRHAAGRRRGRIDKDAPRIDGRHGTSKHGRTAASRDLPGLAGHDGTNHSPGQIMC